MFEPSRYDGCPAPVFDGAASLFGRGSVVARRGLVAALLLLGAVPHVFGQGSLLTTDGMRLGLGPNGSVSSLQVGGLEYASSSVLSGFVYREYPASVSSVAPNGSFESGSGSTPTSWSWTGGTGGSWSWDATTGAVGTKSMRMTISGTSPKRSPLLKSSEFTVTPNAAYTFSCQVKTSGLSRGLDFYLLEQNAAGVWTQRGIQSKSGTSNWSTLSLIYTSSPTAVKAYFKVEEYSGYGTAWIDDVKLVDLYSSRVPTAFGGSVSSDPGGLTHTASAIGLDLSARFTTVGAAVRVDATLTDTTGQDRPIELGFRLPLDVPGWGWEQNFVTSVPIVDGKRYENLDTVFGQQTHSVYPFATVRGSNAAFSLATPMVPQMNRFSYDTAWGLRVVWDLGLSPAATKTPSKATVTFWIYASAPKWGMRAAAEKYYTLSPGDFTSTASLDGAWALAGSTPLSSVSNWSDFGWALVEGIGDLDFINNSGLMALHYVDPSGWFRNFPSYAGGPQPSYDVLISALNADAAGGSGTTVDGAPVKEMAQAVIASSPYNELGLYQVKQKSYFWYANRMQIYPVLPDADIPAPSMWSILKKYCVDGRISSAQSSGNHLDGIFLDDITSTFGNVENHRRSLWAHSNYPLSFSWTSRKVMQWDGFSTAEFLSSFRSYVHGKSLVLMSSMNSGMYSWYAPYADITGGETDVVEPVEKVYLRRTLSYGKPWSNLWVNHASNAPPDAPTVLAYLRQGLLLGFFPGFAGEYWNSPSAYNRDRALVKQYIGLIRKTHAAGWRPVNYATPSDAAIFVERFDDQAGSTFYLTAQNSSTSSKSYQMTVDGAALDVGSGAITVKELVGNATLSASRSGSNILFSDSLSAGETALYEITVASGCDATYGDLNQDGGSDTTDLVILSHYLVGNMTQGAAPFTAPLAKADCDRSGAVDAVDLVVLQNYLAGNLACLPK